MDNYLNYDYAGKLAQAKRELSEIELTNDRSKRQRWRELNKIISWLDTKVNHQ